MSGKVIAQGSYPRHVKTTQTGLDSLLNGILLKNSRDSHMHRHTYRIYLAFRIHFNFLFCYKDKNKVTSIYYNQKVFLLHQCIHTQIPILVPGTMFNNGNDNTKHTPNQI